MVRFRSIAFSIILVVTISLSVWAEENARPLYSEAHLVAADAGGLYTHYPSIQRPWQVYGGAGVSVSTPAVVGRPSAVVRNWWRVGLSLPHDLQLEAGIPLVWNLYHWQRGSQALLRPGDGHAALKWTVRDMDQQSPGLMFGVNGRWPTGNNAFGAGVGAPGVEPFVAAGLAFFDTALVVNVGYLYYPEALLDHTGLRAMSDRLIWSVMGKVTKTGGIVWSAEVHGEVAVERPMKQRLASLQRPLWLTLGVSWPREQHRHTGVFGSVLTPGRDAVTGFMLHVRWMRTNWNTDGDADGVPNSRDKCLHMREDPDGFEDDDGCPEHDNDRDGVPDKEDNCPNVKGGPDNGC